MQILKLIIFVGCAVISKGNRTDRGTDVSLNYEKSKKLPNNFQDFPNLSVLVIKNCGLVKIENERFSGLLSLKVLNITRNNLTTFDGKEFSTLENLEVLNLKLNKVTKVPSNQFSSLLNLKELYLDENELQAIDKTTFFKNVKLEIISLSANDIAKLHFKTFSTLEKLREIDLSLNSMTSLQSDVFEKNTNLERLDLSDNNLQHIASSIFANLKKLVKADFEGNPCITTWIASNNIWKLNETISASCSITDAVENEWQKDTIHELRDEIDILKVGAPMAFTKCPTTISIKDEESSECSSIKSSLEETIKKQAEEIENLKSKVTQAQAVALPKTSADDICTKKLEDLQNEMNQKEEKEDSLALPNKTDADE